MTNGSNKNLNGTSTNGSPNSKRTFCIYKASLEDPGFLKFQASMQSFVMWFIDAANVVDIEDNRWDYFLVFEKCVPEGTNVTSDARFYFVGYSTVYRYYAYPDKTRPRVSQMLLLPPFRRNTIGTHLLQTIYNWYVSQRDTLDITAEDPNEEFIYMRDALDCKNCMKLEVFQPDRLSQGWSDEMAREAQEKLRICKRQARKVYEILKLRNLDTSDEHLYKQFRLEIKNRLNAPSQKAKQDCEKFEKRGAPLPDELRAKQVADIARVELLKENYDELERQYRHTIKKLEAMIE
ncbi:Histone acetyltransferase type B catalytic subunit, partial [Fragariocoptes setiger]